MNEREFVEAVREERRRAESGMHRFTPFENQVIASSQEPGIEFLYSEAVASDDEGWNMVSVEIRRWTWANQEDVIVEGRSVCEGETQESIQQVLKNRCPTAVYQRYGIQMFDRLLRNHPTLWDEANNGLGSGTC